MKQPTYTALGDIGIDIYPQTGRHYVGGMALNNAIHATRAGARASVISAVGSDAIGDLALKTLHNEHISTEHIMRIAGGRTQSIEVILNKQKIQEYGKWDLGVLADFIPTQEHKVFLATQDAAISFYLPEFKHFFDVFAGMRFNNTIKIADFTDLSEHYGDVQFMKQYIPAFHWYIFSIEKEGREAQSEQFEKLMRDHRASGLALLGSDGSLVIHKGKKFIEPAKRVKVVDTTGAGDSYVAIFFTSFLQSKDISHAMQRATQYAAQIIQHYGAI